MEKAYCSAGLLFPLLNPEQAEAGRRPPPGGAAFLTGGSSLTTDGFPVPGLGTQAA